MKNNNYKIQKGFITSDLTQTVMGTILLIVSLLFTILFAITLKNDFKERRVKSNLAEKSEEIVSQLVTSFDSANERVDTTIATFVNDYDKNNPQAFIQNIQQALPTSLRVIISTKNFSDIKPEYFPGINYATLDMLKKTKKMNKNPIAEIHLFGQKDQYLNYIHILSNSDNSYLIISLRAEIILNNFTELSLADGRINITQNAGEYSVVNLKSWGEEIKNSDVVSNVITIPNSFFKIEYTYKPAFYLFRSMTTTSAILGLISAILLFIGILLNTIRKAKIARELTKQTNTYIHVNDADMPRTIEETIGKHKSKEIKKIEDRKTKSTAKIELDETIFRAYDIRGIVDEGLTEESVKLIGQAIGTENLNRGKSDIIVARDGRLSGERLLQALIEGLIKSGCNVINIGAVPTGVLYFATHHLGTGSGVMLTGSHNPPDYNGLKIVLDGETLAGKLIKDLYKSIINHELVEGDGSEQEMDIVDDYVDYISSDIQLENELKVVVDSGNGIGGEVGPQLLQEIGCEVIPLHCEIDGNFPNHHPDPSVPENLKDLILTVQATGADLGIAFDGDADRLGVVTKQGEMIYPDRILMLFAQDVLTRQPGASIIFDVKCTGHLPKEIVKNGGLPIIWKTGHSFIKAKIKETNAALAGEMSGHFFFNERWFGFDDGIYAAARLLEIIDHLNQPAEEIFASFPNSVSTPELKCHTEEGENYAFMEKFQKIAEFPDANLTTIDGIRADFADGWGLVRCSNTTPCLVMRFDADNEQALEKIKEEFRVQILAVDDSLELPF